MKRGDLVIALDINCGTYERHTKRDEEGLMTFEWELILAKSTKSTSVVNEIYGQLENTFVNAIREVFITVQ